MKFLNYKKFLSTVLTAFMVCQGFVVPAMAQNYDNKKDFYSFLNSSDVFKNGAVDFMEYEISKADLAKLMEGLSSDEKSAIKHYKESEWGGSCYGMSVSAILNKEHLINVSDYNEKKIDFISEAEIKPNKDDTDVGKLESMINYYLLSQYVKAVQDNDYGIGDESNDLNRIIDKLENNEAIALGLYFKNGGGHEVVAYDLKKIADDKWKFKVYDCAMGSDKIFTVTVTDNDGVYTKECAEWEEAWESKIRLADAISGEEVYDVVGKPKSLDMESEKKSIYSLKDGGSLSSRTLDYDYLMTNYKNFTISKGDTVVSVTDGNVKADNELKIMRIIDRNPLMPGEEQTEWRFRLPMLTDDDDDYVIEPLEKTKDTYETEVYGDTGVYAYLASDKPGTFFYNSNQYFDVEFDEQSEFYIAYADNDTKELPWYETGISGKTDNILVYGNCEGEGITVSSNNIRDFEYDFEDDFSDVVISNEDIRKTIDSVSTSANEITFVTNGDDSVSVIVGDKESDDVYYMGYAVILDANGGTLADGIDMLEANINNEDESKDYIISSPGTPVREGYRFTDWFTDEELTSKFDFSKKVSENMILYAGWEKETDSNTNSTISFGSIRDVDASSKAKADVNITIDRTYMSKKAVSQLDLGMASLKDTVALSSSGKKTNLILDLAKSTSDNCVITVMKGTKIETGVSGSAEKKAHSAINKNGIISAKKATGGTPDEYMISGKKVLVYVLDGAVENGKKTVQVPKNSNFTINVNSVMSKDVKLTGKVKASVASFSDKFYYDDMDHLVIKGKSGTKGNAKLNYVINGKKYTINIKVK